MDICITESDMEFGPFQEDKLIHIEKISQYTSIQQGMRITELIYFDSDKARLVSLEAKTTAPNPYSKETENPQEKFQDYVTEIREKFENSLDIYVNMALKNEVPTGFKKIDYKKVEILFILVIKKQERAWLKDVKDALEMAVRSIHRTNKMWKCKVLVLNEDIAKRKKLIK